MFILTFFLFLSANAVAAATGSLFPPGLWYQRLDKPRWTPPNWAFPVVWTVLYLLSAFAAARMAMIPGSAVQLGLWSLQLALNLLWTPVFFGLHRMRAGLVIILALLVVLTLTVISFYIFDPVAGLALVPYLLWVMVAAALNLSLLRRNEAEGV